MATTEKSVDNGVNVEALLGAREALPRLRRCRLTFPWWPFLAPLVVDYGKVREKGPVLSIPLVQGRWASILNFPHSK